MGTPPATPPQMTPYATNIAAFGNCDANEPGFSAYCTLVALELTYKANGAAVIRHDVLATISAEPTLVPMVTAVTTALAALQCNDPGKQPARVRPGTYPDLRYLRHQADWATHTSTVAEVADTVAELAKLTRELRRQGVQLW